MAPIEATGPFIFSQIFQIGFNQSMFKHHIFALPANPEGEGLVIETVNDHKKQH